MSALVKPTPSGELAGGAAALEALIVQGDLSKLSPVQRVDYYRAFCEHLDLNPVTRPFDYLSLGGKLVLYANKGCTEQLRAKRAISLRVVRREKLDDVYLVEVEARQGERVDFATGAVPLGALKGEAYANAVMKAETKAKRRATLSICGLGMMDESEVDSVPNARRVAAAELETPAHPRAIAAAPAEPAAPADDDGLEGFMDPKAKAAPAPPERPMTDNKTFLSRMEFECRRVGDAAFKKVLGVYESAVYVVDREEQKRIYFELVDLPDTQEEPEPTEQDFQEPPSRAAAIAAKLKGKK